MQSIGVMHHNEGNCITSTRSSTYKGFGRASPFRFIEKLHKKDMISGARGHLTYADQTKDASFSNKSVLKQFCSIMSLRISTFYPSYMIG